jgi:protein-S-isoprenylcysteine O-methyltransferase Ste14
MATVSNSIVLGCWITFLAFWIVSAWRVKAIAERQSVLSALIHRIPLGLSYFLMANWHLPPSLNWPVTPHQGWARLMGDLVCGLGLFVTLWARWTLAGNWSGDVTFKQDHELIKSGPYRFVRHPIYTGLLVMCLGTAIVIGQLRGWLALPLMATAFWIKLKQEERLLLRHFPDAYRDYCRQVKALIPFVI